MSCDKTYSILGTVYTSFISVSLPALQERMERRSRKRPSSARSEKMERVSDR
jgi:hypothetical protein